jgi:hypothetical protein
MKKYLSFQNSKNRIKHINSDFIGAISAFLCIIHCAIVPILMGVHSFYYAGDLITSTHIEHNHVHEHTSFIDVVSGSHWHTLDYFFVVITLIAVYFATRTSKVIWISVGLWSAAILFVVSILLQESIAGVEYIAYFASALLIVFHFLNQRLGKKIRLNAISINKNELNFDITSFDTINLETENQSKKVTRVSCAC